MAKPLDEALFSDQFDTFVAIHQDGFQMSPTLSCLDFELGGILAVGILSETIPSGSTTGIYIPFQINQRPGRILLFGASTDSFPTPADWSLRCCLN